MHSATGIYHVLLRGINRQNIFEDDQDRNLFLEILSDVKDTTGLVVHCYCLMSNHVHLLVEAVGEPLGATMKRIAVRYVVKFNAKYERVGHLFQDRFSSRPVEEERYVLAVVRYICQNPTKAGLCAHPGEYRWSSCQEYLGLRRGLTDSSVVLELFSRAPSGPREAFAQFLEEVTQDRFLDAGNVRKTDSQLREFMQTLCGFSSASGFQTLDAPTRNACLRQLKDEGFSQRQIARVTGVPFEVIRRN